MIKSENGGKYKKIDLFMMNHFDKFKIIEDEIEITKDDALEMFNVLFSLINISSSQ